MMRFGALVHECEAEAERILTSNRIYAPLATGNNAADIFRLIITNGCDIVDLSNCEVQAFFIRPDFQTVQINGIVNGNACEVALSEDCYLYSGAYRLTVKIKGADSVLLTAAAFDGFIIDTHSEHFFGADDVDYLLTASGENFVDATGSLFAVMREGA